MGSVRFFKRLFGLILLSFIVVPTTLSVVFFCQRNNALGEITSLETRLEAQNQQELVAQAGLGNFTVAMNKLSPDLPEVPSWQLLHPDMYNTSSDLAEVATEQEEHKVVYLTFDDGPSAQTDALLSILAEKNVKATFFIVGAQLDKKENQERLRRIVEQGHAIGLHSDSHTYSKIYESVEDWLDDFHSVWTKVKEVTGQEVYIFRFPGGSINGYNIQCHQELISEMLRRGFVYYDWNVSAQDAVGSVSKQQVQQNSIKTKGYQRVILLMHEKKVTVASLEKVIDLLTEQGYSFSALDPSVKPIAFSYLKNNMEED